MEDPAFPARGSGGVEWTVSARLESGAPCLRHAFLGRLGGQSGGLFGSLNLGPGRGDSAENVSGNRGRVAQALALPREPLTLRQVHGDRVVTVRAGDHDRFKFTPPEADAYITALRGVPLMVLTADCLPVVVCDIRTPALGVIHAGWRGTVLSIVMKTVKAMMEEYGTRPGDCRAAIGPGIRRDCYEVGAEVRDAFERQFPYSAELFTPTRDGHWNADLKEANRRQLLDAGIGEGAVNTSSLCTHCGEKRFFSARRDGIDSGRQGAVAWLE